MGYLQDILGLLSLRENQGLGQAQLRQRAKEFELEYGLDKEQAERAAQQWQQRFQEAQDQKRFEQAQELAQQNRQNTWQDWARGASLPTQTPQMREWQRSYNFARRRSAFPSFGEMFDPEVY